MRPLRLRLSRRALGCSAAVLAMAAVASNATPALADDPNAQWVLPVEAPITRPFVEPIAQFGAGHRGVDFAAAPGTPVGSAGDGVVSFAGAVAGALHVVVAHEGGLRTSYSFLSRTDVRIGVRVQRGDVVGIAGGTGDAHGPGVLHFGLRVGGRYVDPMLLFQPRDLTELVRLVPADERSSGPSDPDDEADALRWLVTQEGGGANGGCGDDIPIISDVPFVSDAVSAACDAVEWSYDQAAAALDAGLDLLRRAGEEAAAFVERVAPLLHELLKQVTDLASFVARVTLLSTPLGRLLTTVFSIGERIGEWLTRECDDDVPAADGTGGSRNLLFAVGGIDSERRWRLRRGPAGRRTKSIGAGFGLDWRSLGYENSEVAWFSYRRGSPTYSQEDTYGSVVRKARLMSEQLKEQARLHPGRAVDLMGHSQGGLVVRVFLHRFYEGSRDEYPPIGKVVLFASPQEGAPLATLAERIHATPLGMLALDLWDDSVGLGPRTSARSVKQLSEDSRLVERYSDERLPRGIEVLSLSGSLDFVVPAGQTEVEGAQHLTVTANHSGIVHDDEAMRATRAFLEGRALPCQGLLDGLAAAVAPPVIAEFERAVADAVAPIP
jgi:Peptidase family M23